MTDYLIKNWKHIYILDILDFKITCDSECDVLIHSNIVGIYGLYLFYMMNIGEKQKKSLRPCKGFRLVCDSNDKHFWLCVIQLAYLHPIHL